MLNRFDRWTWIIARYDKDRLPELVRFWHTHVWMYQNSMLIMYWSKLSFCESVKPPNARMATAVTSLAKRVLRFWLILPIQIWLWIEIRRDKHRLPERVQCFIINNISMLIFYWSKLSVIWVRNTFGEESIPFETKLFFSWSPFQLVESTSKFRPDFKRCALIFSRDTQALRMSKFQCHEILDCIRISSYSKWYQ
jgi:hypothetical protein